MADEEDDHLCSGYGRKPVILADSRSEESGRGNKGELESNLRKHARFQRIESEKSNRLTLSIHERRAKSSNTSGKSGRVIEVGSTIPWHL